MNTKICQVCKVEFSKAKTQSKKMWEIERKYCSNKCRLSVFSKNEGYWTGKKRDTSWNIGKKISEEQKRKMVETRRRNGTYRKQTNEERLKLLASRPRGENHYNWKGGITSEQMRIRTSLEMKLWREAVFKRDDWTCKECDKRGGKLNAHHIKPFAWFPELRFAIDNGITLCINCHKKTDNYAGKSLKRKIYSCTYHQ